MKQYYNYMIGLAFMGGLLTACEKQEPPFYDGGSDGSAGVYFDYDADKLTKTVNFADYITEAEMEEVEVTVKVKLLGYISESERRFVLKARPADEYEEAIAEVSIPVLSFLPNEYEKNIKIKVTRPVEQNKEYAACLYIEPEDPDSQLGIGVKEKSEFVLKVKESYQAPDGWQWSWDIAFGEWTPEKHRFFSLLLDTKNYTDEYYFWSDLGMEVCGLAADSLRQYRQKNPGVEPPFAFSFYNDGYFYGKYRKPYYWGKIHDELLGEYTTENFLEWVNKIQSQTGEIITTSNEEYWFAEDKLSDYIKPVAQGHPDDALEIMAKYNEVFSWHFETGDRYADNYGWVQMYSSIDYNVIEPAPWSDPMTKDWVISYYGEYSDAKYKFMIKAWLEHQEQSGEKFVLVQMFPVMVGFPKSEGKDDGKGDEGPVVMWDDTIGGQAAMNLCHDVFIKKYDEEVTKGEKFDFDFPRY